LILLPIYGLERFVYHRNILFGGDAPCPRY
jgi:hypothetical protein